MFSLIYTPKLAVVAPFTFPLLNILAIFISSYLVILSANKSPYNDNKQFFISLLEAEEPELINLLLNLLILYIFKFPLLFNTFLNSFKVYSSLTAI